MIEVIEVGEKRIRCLRLTKYNPDYVPRTENAKIEEVDDDGLHTIDDSTLGESRVSTSLDFAADYEWRYTPAPTPTAAQCQ